jgi:hypothetical protein
MAFRWASDQSQRSRAAARLKDWLREALEADDDLVISVSEVDCAEATSCGGQETVFALFWPDRSEKFKIQSPMKAIEPIDLVFALRAAGLLPK